jgi:hypothetical protein
MKIVHGTFINLAYRTDKLRHITGQINKLPIPFLRTEGVVVTTVEPYRVEDYIEHGSLRHRGIVGCFLAHRNALANLLELAQCRRFDADDYVLVIEDDVRIDARFLDHVMRLPDCGFADLVFFDIANLAGKNPKEPGVDLDRSHLVDERNDLYYVYDSFPAFMGAFCYAVKTKRLRVIVDRLDKTQTYKDVDGFYYQNFRCYAYITHLISVDGSFYSDRHFDAEWNERNRPDRIDPAGSRPA